MSNDSKELLGLLDNVRESVKCIGAKKTVAVLKKAQMITGNADIIDFVIRTVIDEWKGAFSKNDFFKQNIRGDIVVARNMIFVLVSKVTGLTPKDISGHMKNISDFTIRNAICNYHKLDRENRFDKIIIERHERVLMIVKSTTEKKEKQKNTKKQK